MGARKNTRQDLIAYIKKNDVFYFGASFEKHSLEQLVMLKTSIESEKRHEKRKQA